MLAVTAVLGLAPRPQTEVMGSPIRQQMLKIISETPGLPANELRIRAGLHWGNLAYHLGRLTEAGLVTTRSVRGRRLVFCAGAEVDDAPQRVLLVCEITRRVARSIATRPGRTVGDLASELGLSRRVAYHHVSRLVRAGLVTSSSSSGYQDLRPTQKLEALLAGR